MSEIPWEQILKAAWGMAAALIAGLLKGLPSRTKSMIAPVIAVVSYGLVWNFIPGLGEMDIQEVLAWGLGASFAGVQVLNANGLRKKGWFSSHGRSWFKPVKPGK